jgi:hypothetical protein
MVETAIFAVDVGARKALRAGASRILVGRFSA